MTKKAHAMRRGIALLVGCLVGIPAVSQAAQERKSPLADAPAIRKRLELRDKRFELGVGAMQTLNQDFYNAMLVDVKVGFHITDYLAITGSFGYNLTPNWRTSFNSKLNTTLASSCHADPITGDCDGKNGNPTPENDKTPTQAQASAAQNRIAWIGLAQVEFAPITGKFSLFSKIFMNYDFYVIGGAAFVNLIKKGNVEGLHRREVKDAEGKVIDIVYDPPGYMKPVTGMKIGPNFGLGMHAFVNNFFALNLELRDVMYKNNPAGRAITSAKDHESHDQTWTHNLLVGLNFMFFLPADVKSSR
jgi:outer membrane beta-barrel protein